MPWREAEQATRLATHEGLTKIFRSGQSIRLPTVPPSAGTGAAAEGRAIGGPFTQDNAGQPRPL
jgi:hypothetical protein